jgi:hypothetical protein
MKMRIFVGVLAALGMALTSGQAAEKEKPQAEVKVGEFRLSGPYTHDNLTIFLIHGEDKIKGKTFLTLAEALAQKKAIVHETKNVNELAIENVSADSEIFIQSGDIVKGGQQDRLLAFDVIVPPKSGKMPIASYCVEAGRWTQRGKEAVEYFATAGDQLPAKGLKLAAKAATSPERLARVAAGRLNAAEDVGDQSHVWMEVAALQKKLKMNLKSEVQAGESKSSLQLTLENKKVQEAAAKYVQKLSTILDDQCDVIGYAFAINGKVNSVEVFAANGLFKKLWPRMLQANAVEALAEMKKDAKLQPATADAVKACMEDAEKGKTSSKDITKRTGLKVQETGKNILFETRDQERKGVWVHRSYLAY